METATNLSSVLKVLTLAALFVFETLIRIPQQIKDVKLGDKHTNHLRLTFLLNKTLTSRRNWRRATKVGLSSGFWAQHCNTTLKTSWGQSSGLGSRSPSLSTLWRIWFGFTQNGKRPTFTRTFAGEVCVFVHIVCVLTWLPFRPSHGSCPCVNISQRVTPNIHVSVAWENVLVFRLSGAHLQQDTKQTAWSLL